MGLGFAIFCHQFFDPWCPIKNTSTARALAYETLDAPALQMPLPPLLPAPRPNARALLEHGVAEATDAVLIARANSILARLNRMRNQLGAMPAAKWRVLLSVAIGIHLLQHTRLVRRAIMPTTADHSWMREHGYRAAQACIAHPLLYGVLTREGVLSGSIAMRVLRRILHPTRYAMLAEMTEHHWRRLITARHLEGRIVTTAAEMYDDVLRYLES